MNDVRTRIGLTTLLLALFTTASCDDAADDFKRKNTKVEDPAAPKCTDVGKNYLGFAGTKLEDKRVNAQIGTDRLRIKPYSALKGEYERTIGAAPATLQQSGASFGTPPDRFSAEPRASAIQVYTAFRVAFDGCLTFTETAPEFAAVPSPDTAAAQCKAMARKFWSRTPSADEVQQCTQVALVDSATEASPRRRWAYTCATLLSTSGFLTY